MTRRGETLREHILWTAKDVFMELGFERTSMDLVAKRASTTKRSVYAHFQDKETLFLSILDLVRRTFLSKVKTPADYSAQPAEALTMFCGRYLEILLHKSSIQLCRLSMGEIGRFPEQAGQCFELLFTDVHESLSAYFVEAFSWTDQVADDVAHELLGQVLHPRYHRALFGMDELAEHYGEETVSPDFDLKPIRRAVAELLGALPQPVLPA